MSPVILWYQTFWAVHFHGPGPILMIPDLTVVEITEGGRGCLGNNSSSWKISLFSILLNFLIKFLSHTFNSWCTQNRESNSTYLYANLLKIIVVFLNSKGTRDVRSHALLHLLESETVCRRPGYKEPWKTSLLHSVTLSQLIMGSAMLLTTHHDKMPTHVICSLPIAVCLRVWRNHHCP